jgi:hypothetical protein
MDTVINLLGWAKFGPTKLRNNSLLKRMLNVGVLEGSPLSVHHTKHLAIVLVDGFVEAIISYF